MIQQMVIETEQVDAIKRRNNYFSIGDDRTLEILKVEKLISLEPMNEDEGKILVDLLIQSICRAHKRKVSLFSRYVDPSAPSWMKVKRSMESKIESERTKQDDNERWFHVVFYSHVMKLCELVETKQCGNFLLEKLRRFEERKYSSKLDWNFFFVTPVEMMSSHRGWISANDLTASSLDRWDSVFLLMRLVKQHQSQFDHYFVSPPVDKSRVELTQLEIEAGFGEVSALLREQFAGINPNDLNKLQGKQDSLTYYDEFERIPADLKNVVDMHTIVARLQKERSLWANHPACRASMPYEEPNSKKTKPQELKKPEQRKKMAQEEETETGQTLLRERDMVVEDLICDHILAIDDGVDILLEEEEDGEKKNGDDVDLTLSKPEGGDDGTMCTIEFRKKSILQDVVPWKGVNNSFLVWVRNALVTSFSAHVLSSIHQTPSQFPFQEYGAQSIVSDLAVIALFDCGFRRLEVDSLKIERDYLQEKCCWFFLGQDGCNVAESILGPQAAGRYNNTLKMTLFFKRDTCALFDSMARSVFTKHDLIVSHKSYQSMHLLSVAKSSFFLIYSVFQLLHQRSGFDFLNRVVVTLDDLLSNNRFIHATDDEIEREELLMAVVNQQDPVLNADKSPYIIFNGGESARIPIFIMSHFGFFISTVKQNPQNSSTFTLRSTDRYLLYFDNVVDALIRYLQILATMPVFDNAFIIQKDVLLS